jgi:Phytanoyl-CoA dioxygenase (PhyH)
VDDPYFNKIASSATLPAASARELLEEGFVVIPGPFSPRLMQNLAETYDSMMQSDTGSDFKIASTTTRLNDIVNRGPAFDDLYLHFPLLEACRYVIRAPFKLSSLLGRTLRAGSAAQRLHSDMPRDSPDAPMVGFILMIDDFETDNGATQFIPTSQNWADVPSDHPAASEPIYPERVLACGQAGSMIIFDASILHGHTANSTTSPRRSIQGYFVQRGARSGTNFSSRMSQETFDRISPFARYLLSV